MAVMCYDMKPFNEKLAIERFEDKYEIDFSDTFKEFFRENNGGIPNKNIFSAKGREYEIRCFLSFNDDAYNSIKNPFASFQEETHGKIVPIAKDSGDSYFCMNVENEKIYFWDKDDNLYYCIAETLTEFLEYLQ